MPLWVQVVFLGLGLMVSVELVSQVFQTTSLLRTLLAVSLAAAAPLLLQPQPFNGLYVVCAAGTLGVSVLARTVRSALLAAREPVAQSIRHRRPW